ncbi:MAG TPA: AMP-binding protein, partial [Halobacteriales archaeon]|nr:AMP-binding protein [Halobacteriales archaeon]
MAVETVTEAAEPTDFSEDVRSGNALEVYAETARRRGDALAIEMGGWTISHVGLLDRARRFAGGLADLGLEPGDRVLVYLPNCPEYLIGSLGALGAGTPASPANPQYKARELGYQLEDSDAAAVLTHVALRERVAETLAETGRDPHVIVATSGTGAGAGDLPDGDLHFDDVDGEPTMVEVESEDVALQPYTSGTTGRPKGVL